MREVKRNKAWISRMVAGVMVLQLVAPGISAAAEAGVGTREAFTPKADTGLSVTDAVYPIPKADEGLSVTDTVYQIQNPGFETGDMMGWTVVNGEAFGPDSVSDETTWWAEQIPYNQEGAYHLNGWKNDEAATGVLRSSTFELGGSGWVSFKLGGAKNPNTAYVNIVEAQTGQVIARYGNSAFADVGFPNPSQGLRLANMEQYKADLSEYLGKKLYVEIVDNATADWGVVFADAFFMYHESEPAEGIVATDIKPDIELTSPYEVDNPGFETGDMSGWTVVRGQAFGQDSVSDEATWWAEQIPYNQEGAFHLNGWKHDEAATGVLRSSTFELSGSGWISFKLGGAKNPNKAYINVVEAESGQVIARYGNSAFADVGFPNPAQGLRLANMEQYKADLSEYLGKKLYVEIVDNATTDWGVIFADAFFMYHEAEPAEGIAATDIKPDFKRYQIENPSFETGNLTGWTVEEGEAFGPNSVSDETTFWVEQIPYNQEGTYHLNGLKYNETATGKLRSSTFELGGTGWITFRLGGGKHTDQVYVNVINADTGDMIARYGNTEFNEYGFPDPAQGLRLANMEQYKADLSKYIGKKLYVEIVDNGYADWGVIFADAFHTFNELVPEEGVMADNIMPNEIRNPGFETGNLESWTAQDNAFQVSNDAQAGKEGNYYAKSSLEGQGSITSSTFTLQGTGTINFTVVDIVHPEDAYVALYDAGTNTLLEKTGNVSANEQISWKMQKHYNKRLYIKVIDQSNQARISVDAFRANNTGTIFYMSLDEGAGKKALEEVSNLEHDVNYVFNDARYMDSKDPRWTPRGVKGGALLFDGYSNDIEIDAKDTVPVSDALTLEAWVAPRSYEWGDGNKLSAIVNQSDQDKTEGFALGMYRHGTWSMQVGIGGQWIQVWVKDHPLEKYKWNYVAATFDKKDGIIKLYLNGQEVASQATPVNVPVTPSTEKLIIGKNNRSAEFAGLFSYNMFSGLIDEVKLQNKALTGQEILAEYENVKALHGGMVPEIPNGDIDEDPSVFDGDQHRPQYHAMPPQNWMNEAHAPIYYNGQYHLFYQHNPQGPFWHQIHWGHWVSDDMVHWKNVRPALAPEAGTLDPDGAWSGSAAYDRDGNPVLFYTAGNDALSPNQRTGLATPADLSDPNLEQWVKYPEPVTEQNGNGIHNEFRDPFVWYDQETDKWYQLVTSGLQDFSSGTALVYVSDDMYNWEYKGPLYVSDRNLYPELGTVWELPVLLPLGEDSTGQQKYIFMVNPHEKPEQVPPADDVLRDVEVFYWIGTWDRDNFKFIPDQDAPTKMDVGDGYLTAESGMVTPDGRTVVYSMVQNVRTPQAEYQAGWAHNLALPVSLSLDEHDELRIEPIEELQSLRGDKVVDFTDENLAAANQLIHNVKGDMLEIVMEIDPGEAQKFGLKVRRSDNGQEETLIYYDKTNGTFNVDRTKSSIDPDVRVDGIQGGAVDLDGENLKLHIFLDRSVVEAFANDKKKLTTRVYVGRYDSLGLQVWADNDITVKSMEVWNMNALTGEPAAPVDVPDNWDNSVYTDITDLPNHDFATGDLTGWITEGDAFQDVHVTDAKFFWDTIYFNPSHKIPGGYHLWGFNEEAGGDSLTGTLKSQNFVLGGNGKLNFLVSGGRDLDKLYVALVRASDGKELFKETATNYEEYQRKIWDASQYIGEELYIKVVDQSTGGFGHINVDDFNVPVKVQNPANPNNPTDPTDPAGPPDPTGPSEPANPTDTAVPSSPPGKPVVPASKPESQNSLLFELGKGERQVLFPATLAANDGKNALKIKHADVEIEVPAEVLKDLQAMVTGSELGQAKISFEMEPLTSEQSKELVGQIGQRNQAAISVAGEIYEFKLSIVKPDGTKLTLEKFSKPITIRLVAQGDSRQDITGIYYIPDDGSLEYMGGTYADGKWTAKVSHFSKYAVLTYDKSFEDVTASYWAHDVIKRMAAKQIVLGVREMEFAPKQKVSRAEFASLITRALGITGTRLTAFKDVEPEHWYASSIAAAYEAGIVTGRRTDTFAPEETISREEMASMIYKAYLFHTGQNPVFGQRSSFNDAGTISAWAADAVAASQELGLVTGRGNQLFMPHETVNRAESAQIISLLLDKVNK
ncbi:GH32 C-terminal domain-containing protein [Paenibacillus phytohabitans]|uniref:GH32 C-terminal domain-containing protein n=1 Tax=Paenibacillus phytohabitans TaxID=2654978 RepID=UPI00300B94AF